MDIHGNRVNSVKGLFEKEKIRQGKAHWEWLQKDDGSNIKRLTKKNANKFLFACIIDYQSRADHQWEKARKFTETDLRDPVNLWKVLSRYNWRSLRKKYRYLHRFPQAHKRIVRIARSVDEIYAGDARNIWRKQEPRVVEERFEAISLGEQLTRMAIGALLDSKQIKGTGDVKADLNVKRVLGRIFIGKPVDEDQAIELSRKLHPRNPWRYDSVMYFHGQYVCKSKPMCDECNFSPVCKYYKGT